MKKEFKISGMTCQHCSSAVESIVSGLPGVEKVKANWKKGSGKVTFDDSLVTTAQIIEKIEEVGYEAEEA